MLTKNQIKMVVYIEKQLEILNNLHSIYFSSVFKLLKQPHTNKEYDKIIIRLNTITNNTATKMII